MNLYWLSRDGGAAEGPFAEEQLLTMWQTGQVSAGALVTMNGEEEWQPITEIISSMEAQRRGVDGDGSEPQFMQSSRQSNFATPITKACPMCGEQILLAAKKCKHCGELLDRSVRHPTSAPKPGQFYSYDEVPFLRRSEINSLFVIFGLFTGITLILPVIMLLSGDIFYNKTNPDGTLRKWSFANKVVAVIFLLLWLVMFALVSGGFLSN